MAPPQGVQIQCPVTSAPEFTPRSRIHVTNYQPENVSLMVLPALITSRDKKLKVNVMLDPCSTGSYVTEQAAAELNLQGPDQSLTISGTGGFEVTKPSQLVEFPVTSLDGRFAAGLQANVLDNITGDTPALQWSELKSRWPHLEQVPFASVAGRAQIDVLIGSDHPVFHRVLREIYGSNQNDPVARLTNLGWVCFGPTLVDEFRRKSQTHFTRTYRTCHVADQEPVDNLLRKFWDLETLGIRETAGQSLTPEDKAALKQVKQIHHGKTEDTKLGFRGERGSRHSTTTTWPCPDSRVRKLLCWIGIRRSLRLTVESSQTTNERATWRKCHKTRISGSSHTSL